MIGAARTLTQQWAVFAVGWIVLPTAQAIDSVIDQLLTLLAAIGHVDLYLPQRLALTTNTKQIPQKQHIEQHHRIQCRTINIRAVQGTTIWASGTL